MTDIVERLRKAAIDGRDVIYPDLSRLLPEAADAIGRLRAELANEVDLSAMRLQSIRKARAAALEEAAKVAEDNNSWPREGEEIAADIRALKEEK